MANSTTRSGGSEIDKPSQISEGPREFASCYEPTTVAEDVHSHDLLLPPAAGFAGDLQNPYDINRQIPTSMDPMGPAALGERLQFPSYQHSYRGILCSDDAIYTDGKHWWALASSVEDATFSTPRWSRFRQIGMRQSYPVVNEQTVCSTGLGKDCVDGWATFWPSVTKFLKSMANSQPRVNLIYKDTATSTERVVYWDDGELKVGGDFTHMNALFYAIEKKRSSDGTWIEFCFQNLANKFIGVRYQDQYPVSFDLYGSQPSPDEAVTVFRVGPDPSHDYNYVSFVGPCAPPIAQDQAGASTPNSVRYYWTNQNGSIAFVNKYEAEEVRKFKILTAHSS